MPKSTNKRFTNLKNHTGIRKDNQSDKYIATINIDGKRKTKSFKNLNNAIKWRREFSLVICDEVFLEDLTFGKAWNRFIDEYVSSLEISTQDTYLRKSKIYKPLHNLYINEINQNLISRFINKEKQRYLLNKKDKRTNFNHELRILKTFFNWYKEMIDYTYVNPILKRHLQIGKIKEKKIKNKKMNYEQIESFFNEIQKDKFWYGVSRTQFFLSARIQEVAGLQKSSVDLKNRTILIKDVAVWGDDKKLKKLKEMPKNSETRTIYINDELYEILKERLKDKSSSFVFHINGEPLKYRSIQYHYEKALKACGLFPEFSSTHWIRHSMATLTRRVTGNLNMVQAMTGHKDQRMVQHYASMDQETNKEAQLQILNFINKQKLKSANKREQSL